jgi:hypothetical protein
MDLDSFDDSSFSYTTEQQQPQIQNLKSTDTKKPRKKLTTEQIIAIVLLGFVVVGIVMMVLAFVGVFNTTGATISLTPSVSPAAPGTAVSVIP